MRHRIDKRMPWSATFCGLVLLAFLVPGTPAATAQSPADDEAMREIQAERYARQSLRVNVWVDKGGDEVYSRGEAMQVGFQTNEDAYVVVYHIDVEGRVTVLWPTSRFDDGFAFGRHEYRLPASGGPRLRAAAVEGVGYVNAVASRYPYDLRDLDVDFHHEAEASSREFYVAGDPFLAMNEVNFAVTGLEDPSEYVVTNYVSYYVHRPVDHPRYLCLQCHDDDAIAAAPYDSECTIVVRYDYDWSNRWWDNYGFYPAYHYPVYYYVDPWTWSPWVNYWYRPWYVWPWGGFGYRWDYVCYDWHHSPHWQDHHGVGHDGHRRYRPLDKSDRYRDLAERGGARFKSARVTDERPDDARIAAMKDRRLRQDARGAGDRADAPRIERPSGGRGLRNVAPAERSTSKFTRDDAARPASGLRVPGERGTTGRRGEATVRDGGKSPQLPRRGETGAGREDGRTVERRDAPDSRRQDDARIRPVEPREGPSPTWSGRRGAQPRSAEPARPADKPRTNTRSRVEKNEGSRGATPSSPPPRVGGDGGSRRAAPSAPPAPRGGGSSGGGSSGGERGNSGVNSGGGGRGRGGR